MAFPSGIFMYIGAIYRIGFFYPVHEWEGSK